MSARVFYPSVGRFFPILAASVFTFLVGCGEREQIRSYKVAKEQPAPVAAPASSRAALPESTEVTDRMLAAVLPAGAQAWFFKVVGPVAAVDEREKEIVDFLASVRLEAGKPRWERPAGWKEDPASQMRLATLWIPSGDKPMEMSVMALPWRGTQDELLANVNRWRGQMQLDEIDAAQLKDVTREVAAGNAEMTLVDLRGQFQGGGMMAPFAGGLSRGPGQTAQKSDSELPAGHPPVDANAGTRPESSREQTAGAVVPQFEAPASWKSSPAQGIRRAMFTVADGEREAIVTVFDFATNSGPMMTDPLENVNRWRGEIRLTPLKREDLASQSESMEIDGRPATYVALIPDAERPEQSQAAEATLAAMVTNDDRIWFFKMKGSRDLVAAQQDVFRTFLKSVKFPDERGESDGNQ